MEEIRGKVGCEEYLYRCMKCCLHPSVDAIACPEPICAIDFPGGINAYLRYKRMIAVLMTGVDIEQAAEILHISVYAAKYLFRKGSVITKVRIDGSTKSNQTKTLQVN